MRLGVVEAFELPGEADGSLIFEDRAYQKNWIYACLIQHSSAHRTPEEVQGRVERDQGDRISGPELKA